MKSTAWKYATAFAVVLIVLNPEMIELALFVDAIGLELFLMLLEIQVAAIISALLRTRIKPVFAYIKRICAICLPKISWKNINEEPGLLVYTAQSPAILMHMLVFSAATSVALNTAS
ncbi:MAG: hypothetical protein AB2792_15470 [Candidatus Thiodiazotropha sp.]